MELGIHISELKVPRTKNSNAKGWSRAVQGPANGRQNNEGRHSIPRSNTGHSGSTLHHSNVSAKSFSVAVKRTFLNCSEFMVRLKISRLTPAST